MGFADDSVDPFYVFGNSNQDVAGRSSLVWLASQSDRQQNLVCLMSTTQVPVRQSSIAMGKVWLFSLPAIVGIASWLAVRMHHFAFDNRYLYGARVERALMVVFVLMLWMCPFSGITAIILARNSQVVGWKRPLCYALNGFCGLFALFCFMGYWLWRRAGGR